MPARVGMERAWQGELGLEVREEPSARRDREFGGVCGWGLGKRLQRAPACVRMGCVH